MANLSRHSYHSVVPEWRQGRSVQGKMIGVELEVESTNSYYTDLIAYLPDDFISGEHCVVEHDGSLSSDTGMEIVFPPAEYSRMRNGECNTSRAMDSLAGRIVETFNGCRAGMHMNVNTNGWSQTKKAYVVSVVNNMDINYLQSLGGRALTNYCRQVRLSSIASYRSSPSDHGCAAGVRSNRIELRFPRSTANKERLKALTIFVELLEEFAEEMDTGGYEAPAPSEVGALFVSYLEALDNEDSRLVLDWMHNGKDR